MTTALNQHIFELKGGGANGGVPAAIVACHSQTTLYHGASFFIKFTNISEKLLCVDFQLTCEWIIDKRTSYCKVPGVIAKFVHDQKLA